MANQYLPFGTGGSANTLTYSAYSALTTLIANGFQPGTALSEQMNTVLRQLSVGVSGVAGLASAYGGADAVDDGSAANFQALLLAAINALIDAKQGWKTGDVKATTDSNMAHHPGWIKANGAVVSRSGANAALFALYGTTYGAGDGSTTFQLPDWRGRAIRALDDGRGIDPARVLGSVQDDALQNITGTLRTINGGPSGAASSGAFLDNGASIPHISAGTSGSDASQTFDASRVVRTAAETRMSNFAALVLIKL